MRVSDFISQFACANSAPASAFGLVAIFVHVDFNDDRRRRRPQSIDCVVVDFSRSASLYFANANANALAFNAPNLRTELGAS